MDTLKNLLFVVILGFTLNSFTQAQDYKVVQDAFEKTTKERLYILN